MKNKLQTYRIEETHHFEKRLVKMSGFNIDVFYKNAGLLSTCIIEELHPIAEDCSQTVRQI